MPLRSHINLALFSYLALINPVRMSKHVLNELDELLEAAVITEDEAGRIRNYYAQKPQPENNRQIIIFAILGSLLVGMGLILIIAHNWDALPKAMKLGIGLFPMFVAQALCGYLLWKKSTSIAWRESASVFLVFAIATAIAIVSQVYNMDGTLASFLFYWMVLTLPIIYVMRSSAVSLLFWIGITWYACDDGYIHFYNTIPYKYWLLALSAVPWYIHLCRKDESAFTYFHNWIIAISLVITLGTFANHTEELILPAYILLFGIFILAGQLPVFSRHRLVADAYLVLGSLGLVTLLLSLSFKWYWQEIYRRETFDWLYTSEGILCIVLLLIAGGLFAMLLRHQKVTQLLSKSYVIPVFIGLFIIGLGSPYTAQVLMNIFVLVLAVYTIREGAKADHLGRMNYGLLIFALLIICRFFDTNLSFVIRGLLFVLVGLGFFAMNYRMIRKRKEQRNA